jgi:hypothetical protein
VVLEPVEQALGLSVRQTTFQLMTGPDALQVEALRLLNL